MSINSDISVFCLDDLPARESGVLKPSAVAELELICGFNLLIHLVHTYLGHMDVFLVV